MVMDNEKGNVNNDARSERTPFFSIIIPVYNVAPYLRECLDSVLAQTYPNWECLCVDDGSTDDSADILVSYLHRDSRIRVIHQANRGLSAARNRGINTALATPQSYWLTFIDADDWVASNYLATLAEGCQQQTGCCAVSVQRIYAHETPPPAPTSTPWCVVAPHDFWARGCLPMTAWAKAFPKRFFTHIRFPEGRYHEDEVTTHHLLFQGQTVATTSAPLYYYRQRKGGIMGKASPSRALDLIAAHEDQAAFFTQQGYDDLANAVRRRLIYEYADAAWRLGQKEALQNLKNLLIAHPQHTPFTQLNPLTMWLTAYVHYPFCRLRDLLHRRGLLGTLKQYLRRFHRA